MHSVRGFVRGRVQGVGFRYFVRSNAHRHSVTGYANNLADGRVEFLLQGEVDSVEKVVAAIHQGPAYSRVDEVMVGAAQDLPPSAAFTTGQGS